VDRLRREIEPVSGANFMRFLFAWQHVSADSRLCGEAALPAVLERLACFEAAAPSSRRAFRTSTPTGSTASACPARGYGDGAYLRPGEGAAAALRMAPVTVLRRQHVAAREAITTPAELDLSTIRLSQRPVTATHRADLTRPRAMHLLTAYP
jgi:ATP-dependent Lhr-like helicase